MKNFTGLSLIAIALVIVGCGQDPYTVLESPAGLESIGEIDCSTPMDLVDMDGRQSDQVSTPALLSARSWRALCSGSNVRRLGFTLTTQRGNQSINLAAFNYEVRIDQKTVGVVAAVAIEPNTASLVWQTGGHLLPQRTEENVALFCLDCYEALVAAHILVITCYGGDDWGIWTKTLVRDAQYSYRAPLYNGRCQTVQF